MAEADAIRNEYIGKTLQEAISLRIKTTLRIVVSLDPNRASFKEMCASNPALYTCNIVWFDELSPLGLRAVASELIGRSLPEFSRAVVDEISALACDIHRSAVERYRVAQRYFYTLVATYLRIYKEKSHSKK